jgi:hypothetical protein
MNPVAADICSRDRNAGQNKYHRASIFKAIIGLPIYRFPPKPFNNTCSSQYFEIDSK